MMQTLLKPIQPPGRGRKVIWLLFALLATMTVYASEDKGKPGEAEDYQAAYVLVLEGKWSQAEEKLENFLKKHSKSRWNDDAQFWRCYIQARQAENKELAFSCFESFTDAFPKSSYVKDAQAEMVTLARDLVKQGKPEYEEKVRKLRESQASETTIMVLSALRDIGDAQAWDALLDYFDQSDDARIRKAIVGMLDDFERPDVPKTLVTIYKKDESNLVKEQALKTLSSFDQSMEAADFLKSVALDEKESQELRKRAVRELTDFEQLNLLPFFEQLAFHPSPDLAKVAVGEIGEHKTPEAFQALLRIYEKSENKDVRRRILGTLGDDFGGEALDFLTSVAGSATDRDFVRSAVGAMAEIEDPSLLERFKKLLGSATDQDARRYIIRGICELKSPKAAEVLQDFLANHADPETRKEAARGLAEQSGDESIPILKKAALEDSSAMVRKYAIKALGEINSAKAREALIDILKVEKPN